MDFSVIKNETVAATLKALHEADKESFKRLVAPGAGLIHNGEPDDLQQWADLFFFGDKVTKVATISGTEDQGKTVYATLDSEIAGRIDVKLVFTVAEGKVTELNAGRP